MRIRIYVTIADRIEDVDDDATPGEIDTFVREVVDEMTHSAYFDDFDDGGHEFGYEKVEDDGKD